MPMQVFINPETGVDKWIKSLGYKYTNKYIHGHHLPLYIQSKLPLDKSE